MSPFEDSNICLHSVNINKQNILHEFFWPYEGRVLRNLVDTFNSTQYTTLKSRKDSKNRRLAGGLFPLSSLSCIFCTFLHAFCKNLACGAIVIANIHNFSNKARCNQILASCKKCKYRAMTCSTTHTCLEI